MKWEKKGLIFQVDGSLPWARSHAQVPLVERIDDERLRIYYGTRDDKNRTRTSFIEVRADNPREIIYQHPQPILELGEPGTFDDAGVMPSEIVRYKGRSYFFYVGWNTGHTARYRTALGLAVSEDNRSFKKVATGPVMDRGIHDPVAVSCQAIVIEDDLWRTWYMSYTAWREVEGLMEPSYEIKYAESRDGIEWKREGITSVALEGEEGGLACPTVIREEGRYRMWYSVRGQKNYRRDKSASYRIGYAESADGIHFERKDHLAGLDVSAEGWDSAMVAYPNVIRQGKKLLMFYNGNGFGASGLGWAECMS